MTSAGGHRVWPTYGAVSAAKAALESHVRQLAVELAPFGISVNALQAGVTDTPAARRIPGSERMFAPGIGIQSRQTPDNSGRCCRSSGCAQPVRIDLDDRKCH